MSAKWDAAHQQQKSALRAVADLALEWPAHATAFGARGSAVTELILIGTQIAAAADSGSDEDAEGYSVARRADDTAECSPDNTASMTMHIVRNKCR